MKDIIFIALGRVLTAGVSVISLRVITEALTAVEYGVYAILVAFQVFCGLFLINPFSQYLNRNTHQWYSGGVLTRKLISFNYIVMAFSSLGACSVIIWNCFGTAFPSPIMSYISILSVVYAGTWNVTLVSLLNMLGKRKNSVLCNIVTSLFSLLFSYLCVKVLGTASAWLFGQSIGMLLGALLALYMYYCGCCRSENKYDYKNYNFNFISWSDLRIYVFPLAFSTILLWFQTAGYRVFLEKLYGLELLGYFAVNFGLANQLFAIAESMLMQILYPVFYKKISLSSSIESKMVFCDLLNILFPIYLLLATGLLICAYPFITMLVSPKYHNAIYFFYFGVVVELFRGVGALFSNAAQIERKMKKMIIPNLISCIVVLTIILLSLLFNLNLRVIVMLLPLSGMVGVFANFFIMRKYLALDLINIRTVLCFLFFLATVLYLVISKQPITSSGGFFHSLLVMSAVFLLFSLVIYFLFRGYQPFLNFIKYK